jgi:hypothetical protein
VRWPALAGLPVGEVGERRGAGDDLAWPDPLDLWERGVLEGDLADPLVGEPHEWGELPEGDRVVHEPSIQIPLTFG